MCGTRLHPAALYTSRVAAQTPATRHWLPPAAEEECFRAVVDLREAARKLNNSNWENNLALLNKVVECVKALFVPAQKPLIMSSPKAWCKHFSEWWFGD